MSYWDTSCLVKLYTPEPDSAIFHQFLATDGSCITCDVAPLEFWATIRRKETEGMLAKGEADRIYAAFSADISSGNILLLTSDFTIRQRFHTLIERCHAMHAPIFIRTNNALHLAAALCAGESKVVATDKRLREAAVALGLTVFP